jgi:Domain of unknown function (DUF3127)
LILSDRVLSNKLPIDERTMSETKCKGVVHLIEPTKTFGQKGFRKRVVVLEQDNGRFSNFIPFEFIGDSCDSVDSLKVGDEIEVNYRLGGRKWQRDPESEVKFFLSAEANSYRKLSDGASNAGSQDINAALSQEAYDDGGDVPF